MDSPQKESVSTLVTTLSALNNLSLLEEEETIEPFNFDEEEQPVIPLPAPTHTATAPSPPMEYATAFKAGKRKISTTREEEREMRAYSIPPVELLLTHAASGQWNELCAAAKQVPPEWLDRYLAHLHLGCAGSGDDGILLRYMVGAAFATTYPGQLDRYQFVYLYYHARNATAKEASQWMLVMGRMIPVLKHPLPDVLKRELVTLFTVWSDQFSIDCSVALQALSQGVVTHE